ncbi:MAG: hypothetical protein ACTSQA_01440, partial [Candidatus Heimdallarchaeaceae archaeon]
KFSITADEAQDVNLYALNMGVTLTDNATATNLYISDLKLYDIADMSTVLNAKVSTSTGAAAQVEATVAAGGFGKDLTNNSETGDVKFHNASDALMDVIPAGYTVTYIIQATITGSAQYDSVSARLSDLNDGTTDNAIIWGDQTTADIDSDYVKTLPTNYAILSR